MAMLGRSFCVLLALCAIVCEALRPPASAASSPCEAQWVATFGAAPGFDHEVNAVCEFDDGSGAGPQVYAAGKFRIAGSTGASLVARWDGHQWRSLGTGVLGVSVNALAVFDDGTGPALYAGGDFTNAGGTPSLNIAKWDGQSWSNPTGGIGGIVHDLKVHDDGRGPALFLAGEILGVSGVDSRGVIRWDGASWSAVGTGLTAQSGGIVRALEVHDDGAGASLYAAGQFTLADGAPARNIARWDGERWSPLLAGLPGYLQAMESVGPNSVGVPPGLYVGGAFGQIGDEPYTLARWAMNQWIPVVGITPVSSSGEYGVRALAFGAASADASPALYVGGGFTTVAGIPERGVARWDGVAWSTLGAGISGGFFRRVNALTIIDAEPSRLVVGGDFSQAGDVPALCVAAWDGEAWSAFGSGIDGQVRGLTVTTPDDADGATVFVTGSFRSTGVPGTRGVAAWTGSEWISLDGGVDDEAYTSLLTPGHDGQPGTLVVAGRFSRAGSIEASNIAAWDGESWAALGAGVNDRVHALAVFDDGTGPALYAGGNFTQAGSAVASRVAKWDGHEWTPLGAGVQGVVTALAVFDDGSGTALYAGGVFTTAGGVPANSIARWDGASWSALGQGVTRISQPSVLALTPWHVGGEPVLLVGGRFTQADGMPANNLAMWNGSTLSPIDPGVDGGVFAMATTTDRDGEAVYIVGDFLAAGGLPAGRGVRWDGATWRRFRDPVGPLSTIAFTPKSKSEPASMYVGGYFFASPAGDSFLARQACFNPAPLCPGDTNGDFRINLIDLQRVIVAYGRTGAAALPGDVNADGVVDFADLNIVLTNFGAACR